MNLWHVFISTSSLALHCENEKCTGIYFFIYFFFFCQPFPISFRSFLRAIFVSYSRDIRGLCEVVVSWILNSMHAYNHFTYVIVTMRQFFVLISSIFPFCDVTLVSVYRVDWWTTTDNLHFSLPSITEFRIFLICKFNSFARIRFHLVFRLSIVIFATDHFRHWRLNLSLSDSVRRSGIGNGLFKK